MSTTLKSMRWSMLALIAASSIFIWIIIGPGISRANHEGDGAVHVCANNTTGALRLVTAPHHCRSTETSRDLQQAGLTSEVLVVNDETQPVPVSGDPANPIPVTGEVTVNGGSQPSLATKTHTIFHNSGDDGDPAFFDLPETINASFIIVTTQNDQVAVSFWKDGNRQFQFGGNHDSIQNVTVIPLPQQVPVDEVIVACFNLIESCETTLSIVGN